MSETPTALHGLRDTVPPALDHVIARALARVPADRYATASQFGQALQAAIFAATPAAQASQWTTGGEPVATPNTGSRGRWKAGLPLGLGAAAVIAVALWIAGGMPGDTPLEIRTSNILQVTRGEGVEFQPAMSPDGRGRSVHRGSDRRPRIVVRSAVEIGSGGESRPAQTKRDSSRFPRGPPTARLCASRPQLPRSGCEWKEVGKLGGSVQTVSRPCRRSTAGCRRTDTPVVYSRRDSIFAFAADHGEPELLGVHRCMPSTALVCLVAGRATDRLRERQCYLEVQRECRDCVHLDPGCRWWRARTGDGRRAPEREPPVACRQPAPAVRIRSRRAQACLRGRGRSRRASRSPGSVPGISDPHSISVSADGRRLAYSKFTARQNIWSIPIPRSGQVSVRDAIPVTTGNQVIESPQPVSRWRVDRVRQQHPRGVRPLQMPLEGELPS